MKHFFYAFRVKLFMNGFKHRHSNDCKKPCQCKAFWGISTSSISNNIDFTKYYSYRLDEPPNLFWCGNNWNNPVHLPPRNILRPCTFSTFVQKTQKTEVFPVFDGSEGEFFNFVEFQNLRKVKNYASTILLIQLILIIQLFFKVRSIMLSARPKRRFCVSAETPKHQLNPNRTEPNRNLCRNTGKMFRPKQGHFSWKKRGVDYFLIKRGKIERLRVF